MRVENNNYAKIDNRQWREFSSLLRSCSSIVAIGVEFDKVHDGISDFIMMIDSTFTTQKSSNLELFLESNQCKFDCVFLGLELTMAKDDGARAMGNCSDQAGMAVINYNRTK